MIPGVRVAYVVVLCGLAVAGFYLPAMAWWTTALIGAAAMAPVAVADRVTTRRRAGRARSAPPGTIVG
jgi:hypothetical protein